MCQFFLPVSENTKVKMDREGGDKLGVWDNIYRLAYIK